MANYDVFISYRRSGGEYTAKILRDRLEDMGYRVFFDVESLRSGYFNTKLYSVIDECRDFLLILSPGALDRCANPDDWVRLEVERALAQDTADTEYKKGVEMTARQFTSALESVNVEIISAEPNTEFDPMIHNAIMHVEDDAFGENTVAECFQKGFKIGDKIIRTAMVKVAN